MIDGVEFILIIGFGYFAIQFLKIIKHIIIDIPRKEKEIKLKRQLRKFYSRKYNQANRFFRMGFEETARMILHSIEEHRN